MTIISSAASRLDVLHAMPRRGRRRLWIVAVNVVVVLVLAWMVVGAALTPGFEWRLVGPYLFDSRILTGVLVSVGMTLASMAMAIVLGVGVAALRMSSVRAAAGAATAFIWVFRAIPMLVQLLFWYNLAALFPTLGLGFPGLGTVGGVSTNEVIGPLTAALIGLTLHETAYLAEIVRGGFAAVPTGQREAAAALGLSPWRTFRRVVWPQAFRIVIPSLGNQVISLLKATSLVSVIALADLLYSAQLIYAANYRTIPLLVVVSIWYMVITGVLSLAQSWLERRLGDRSHRIAAPTEEGAL
ncbi:amino acid ABC transporter permease [Nocardioides acrostichi]|uniref:Amino acid ABC transporter permease n=1 Tax=Nocardioides acrostichi TaxID=2784339 RepID=A0A930UYX9_9ACTN|nr:amino acid ABC transporter permease [Nocardioides acrostichi]MBF4163453.1 amino acid ABC transporter permease [Nocardioides acrostichi]